MTIAPFGPSCPSSGTVIPGPVNTILGTDGGDCLYENAPGDIIIGYGGNDHIVANGPGSFVFGGNGNDILQFNYYSTGNTAILGTGANTVAGSVGHDFISAPGDYSSIDGNGGGDTIVLGGHHEQVIEKFYGSDAAGGHVTQILQGLIDHVFNFNPTDKLVVEGDGRNPHWHQSHSGMVFIDDPVLGHLPIADVVGHHMTAHDFIFVA
jgi:hypothetical protein